MEKHEKGILDTVLHYFFLLMRYKWLIIIITVLPTIATVVYAIISVRLPPEKSPMPNYYTAEATIFVLQNEQSDISDSVLRALGMSQQSKTAAGFNNGDMILQILRSRTIMDRLVEEFKLQQRYGISEYEKTKLRSIVSSGFNYSYTKNTGSLSITYINTDPVFARDIVNRTIQLLEEWFALNRGQAKEKSKQILEEKLLEVGGDIDKLQNRLKSLQQRYGVLNAQELGVSQATSLANLRSQLIMKEIEIKNYSIYSKINDPRLEQLNEELRNLRELISKNQTTIPDINQDTGKQRSLADVAQEFSQLTNELDIQQRIYNTLSPQYEAAKLSPESQPIFQVFELAEVPDEKTGPKRSEFVFMALGGSFAFSIGLSLLLNQIAEWRRAYLLRNQ